MMCMMWGHTDRPDSSQGKFPFDQLAIEGVGDFCCLAYHGFGEMWGLEGKNAVIFIEPNVDIKLASSLNEDKQNKHNLIPTYSQYQYHSKNHWLCRWYVFSFNGLWLEICFSWFIFDSFYRKIWIQHGLNCKTSLFALFRQSKKNPWKNQVLSGHPKIIPMKKNKFWVVTSSHGSWKPWLNSSWVRGVHRGMCSLDVLLQLISFLSTSRIHRHGGTLKFDHGWLGVNCVCYSHGFSNHVFW